MANISAPKPGLTEFGSSILAALLVKTGTGKGIGGYAPTLRGVVFSMMMLVAILPIAAFYNWVERNSFQRELDAVEESHLIIAQNLSAALSRYAIDAKSIFTLALSNIDLLDRSNRYTLALANFHISYIVVLDAANNEVSRLSGDSSRSAKLPDPALLQELRTTAEAAQGAVVISGIRHHEGTPHFFILQSMGNGQIALAPLGPTYIARLQKSIAFGERGHSMMVDQNGLVVAHPNAEWQRISKNASKLPVVNAMLEGRTGVMQFYSPPMQADMIAGYTFVPETRWGVMVPQPISELAQRANRVQRAAVVVALVQLSLGLVLSWWFSSWLSRPIRSIALAARALSRGGFRTRIGSLPRHTPAEIAQTAQAFDTMVDDIEQMTGRLQFTLAEAEMISGERAKLLEVAQAANAAKSQFVSMVSHELRTPLTSIKGALELLNTSIAGDMSDATRSLLDVAIRNGKRLATMIDDLLDLEKLDAGKLQFQFEDADLGEIIAESVEANSGYGALADVRFQFDRPTAPICANVDPGRLQQVLNNLLSNAAKFSSEGQKVEITLSQKDGQAEIAVRDWGVGIPDQVGNDIFDAFVQADGSDTRVVGGSGLGLSIARMIVWRHQGTLTYESIEGEGTTFTVTLPLVKGTNE